MNHHQWKWTTCSLLLVLLALCCQHIAAMKIVAAVITDCSSAHADTRSSGTCDALPGGAGHSCSYGTHARDLGCEGQIRQYKNGLYAGGTNSLYLYLGATLDTCEHGYKVLNTRDDYSNSGGWVRMCDSAKEVCATYTITTATGATRAITTITSSWPLWSPEKWGTAKSNGAHAAVTLTGDTSAFNVRIRIEYNGWPAIAGLDQQSWYSNSQKPSDCKGKTVTSFYITSETCNDEDGRCYIEGYGERKCYHHGNVNPYEPEPHRTCKRCQAASHLKFTNWAGSCNDGNSRTYNDKCVDGVCKGTSYTCDEPCERYDGSGSCPPTPHYCKINNKCYSNDAYVGDQCLFCHASSSSTVPTTIASVRAGVVCTDNNKCTIGDECTPAYEGCKPGTTVYPAKTPDGHNECQSCNGGPSEGGTDNGLDTDSRYCVFGSTCGCNINGKCYRHHEKNPNNICQWCDANHDQPHVWQGVIAGITGCTDNNLCTFDDVCNGHGQCEGKPYSSPCAPPNSCQSYDVAYPAGCTGKADMACSYKTLDSSTVCRPEQDACRHTSFCVGAGEARCAISDTLPTVQLGQVLDLPSDTSDTDVDYVTTLRLSARAVGFTVPCGGLWYSFALQQATEAGASCNAAIVPSSAWSAKSLSNKYSTTDVQDGGLYFVLVRVYNLDDHEPTVQCSDGVHVDITAPILEDLSSDPPRPGVRDMEPRVSDPAGNKAVAAQGLQPIVTTCDAIAGEWYGYDPDPDPASDAIEASNVRDIRWGVNEYSPGSDTPTLVVPQVVTTMPSGTTSAVPLLQCHMYTILATICDPAGHCTTGESPGTICDKTPPNVATASVRFVAPAGSTATTASAGLASGPDGSSKDLLYLPQRDRIMLEWSGFSEDPCAKIVSFEVHYKATDSGEVFTIPTTGTETTSVDLALPHSSTEGGVQLELQPGVTYCATVIATNNAGLASTVHSSNCIVPDVTPPLISAVAHQDAAAPLPLAASLKLPAAPDAVLCQRSLDRVAFVVQRSDLESPVLYCDAAVGSGDTPVLGDTSVVSWTRLDETHIQSESDGVIVVAMQLSSDVVPGTRLVVSVRCTSAAGLEAQAVVEYPIIADDTPPLAGAVRDLDPTSPTPNDDADFTSSNNHVMSWDTFEEEQCFIVRQACALVSHPSVLSPGTAPDVAPWQELQPAARSCTFPDAALDVGGTYYGVVKAEACTGLETVAFSDGFMYDPTVPVAHVHAVNKAEVFDGPPPHMWDDLKAGANTPATDSFGRSIIAHGMTHADGHTDLAHQSSDTRFLVHYGGTFEDPESDIMRYEVAAGVNHECEQALAVDGPLDDPATIPSSLQGLTSVGLQQWAEIELPQPLPPGTLVCFVVRAINHALQYTTHVTSGVIADPTVAELTNVLDGGGASDEDFQSYNDSVTASFEVVDPESGILKVEATLTDATTQKVVARKTVQPHDRVVVFTEFDTPGVAHLLNGHTYKTTVNVTNHAGGWVVVHSDGIEVDASKPNAGTVMVAAHGGSVVREGDDIVATWHGFQAPHNHFEEVVIGLASGPHSGADLHPFVNVGSSTTHRFPAAEHGLMHGTTAYVVLRVTSIPGHSITATSRPFTIVGKPPSPAVVHQPTIASDGALLVQFERSQIAVASLADELEYKYCVGTSWRACQVVTPTLLAVQPPSIGGDDAVSLSVHGIVWPTLSGQTIHVTIFTNSQSGLHTSATSPSLLVDSLPAMSLRGATAKGVPEDYVRAGCVPGKQCSNTPRVTSTYDSVTAAWVSMHDATSAATAGITLIGVAPAAHVTYWMAVGESQEQPESISPFQEVGAATSATRAGLDMEHSTVVVVTVRAIDEAGNIAMLPPSRPLIVDRTGPAPTTGAVIDVLPHSTRDTGIAQDGSTEAWRSVASNLPAKAQDIDTASWRQIGDCYSAAWPNMQDAESGLSHYTWCVGTSPGSCNVAAEEFVGTNQTGQVCGLTSLQSTEDITLFATVFAFNRVMISSTFSSNGLRITSGDLELALPSVMVGSQEEVQQSVMQLDTTSLAALQGSPCPLCVADAGAVLALDARQGVAFGLASFGGVKWGSGGSLVAAVGYGDKGQQVLASTNASTAAVHATGGSTEDGSAFTVASQHLNISDFPRGVPLDLTAVQEDGDTYSRHVFSSVRVLLDDTPPVFTAAAGMVVTVGTEPGRHRDFVPWTSSVRVHWPPAVDVESGPCSYEVAVLGIAGNPVIHNTSTTWETTMTVEGLTLHAGSMYYAVVTAINGAGMRVSLSSAAFRVDVTPPNSPSPLRLASITGQPLHYVTRLQDVMLEWPHVVDPESDMAQFRVAIGSTPLASDLLNWTAVGLQRRFVADGRGFGDGTVYATLAALNNARLEALFSFEAVLVDSTPPAASGNTNGAPFVTVLPRSVDGSLMPPSAPLTQSDASSVTLKFPTLGDDESGVNAAYTVTVIVNSAQRKSMTSVDNVTADAAATHEVRVHDLALHHGDLVSAMVARSSQAGATKTLFTQSPLLIDMSPPTIDKTTIVIDACSVTKPGSVAVSVNGVRHTACTSGQLQVQWSPPDDPESQVTRVVLSLRRDELGPEVVSQVELPSDVQIGSVVMPDGGDGEYSVCLEADNGAGLHSEVCIPVVANAQAPAAFLVYDVPAGSSSSIRAETQLVDVDFVPVSNDDGTVTVAAAWPDIEAYSVEMQVVAIASNAEGGETQTPLTNWTLLQRDQRIPEATIPLWSIEGSWRLQVVIRACTASGVCTVAASDGVWVDDSPPVCHSLTMVNAAGEAIGSTASSDSMTVCWACEDAESPVEYAVSLSSRPAGGAPLAEQVDVATGSCHVFTGLELEHSTTVHANLVATNKAGLRTTNVSAAVLVDLQPPDASGVLTAVPGLWQDWTGMLPPADHGWLNGTVAAFVRCTTAAQTSNMTADIASSRGEFVASNLRVTITFMGFEDSESGVSKYLLSIVQDMPDGSLRVVKAPVPVTPWDEAQAVIERQCHNGVPVYSAALYLGTESLQSGVAYRVLIQATDKVGWNATALSEQFHVDASAPVAGIVMSGAQPSSDSTCVITEQDLQAAWSGFKDPELSIAKFIVQAGTQPGGDDYLPAHSIGLSTEVNVWQLRQGTLDSSAETANATAAGTTVYVSVTAVDWAGHSTSVSSDGTLILCALDDESCIHATRERGLPHCAW